MFLSFSLSSIIITSRRSLGFLSHEFSSHKGFLATASAASMRSYPAYMKNVTYFQTAQVQIVCFVWLTVHSPNTHTHKRAHTHTTQHWEAGTSDCLIFFSIKIFTCMLIHDALAKNVKRSTSLFKSLELTELLQPSTTKLISWLNNSQKMNESITELKYQTVNWIQLSILAVWGDIKT